MQTISIPMEHLMPMLQLQLDTAGKASLTVTGKSMRPFFRHGRDRVILVPAEGKRKRGDVILYRRDNGAYVLHRIVRIRAQGCFICSGDNQWEPEPVRDDQVLAVMGSFVRDEKEYSLRRLPYRLFVWAWVAGFPARRPVLAVWRRIRKCESSVRKRIRRT